MANWEINDIPIKPSALISTDNFEGQKASGGADSSFKASLAELEKYMLNAYGRIGYNDVITDLNPTTTPSKMPITVEVSSAGISSSITNNEITK